MLKKVDTPKAAISSIDEFREAARALAPAIAEEAPKYVDLPDVPSEVVAQLKAAGLHRAYMPKRYGGYELDWGAHYASATEISQACGSAGWLTGLVFSHIKGVGRFPIEAQDDFFTESPDGILATASAGAGALTAVEGGMKLTGRWGWASGIKHAGGLMVIAKEGDGPLFTHFCLLLPGEYTIEETWDCAGLQSTGSHHVRIENQFIPKERIVERDEFLSMNPPGGNEHESYVYRIRPAPYQKSYFIGVLLGTALGAVNAGIEETATRRGRIFGEKIFEQTPVQVNIGNAVAELDVAKVIFDKYIELLHNLGSNGQDVLGDDLLWGRRNVTFGSRLCLSAADRILGSLGAGGMVRTNRVQQFYRDCRTITTHVELNWEHSLSTTGLHRLGIPTGDPLVDGDLAVETANMLGTQI